jgi:hypothetical protein
MTAGYRWAWCGEHRLFHRFSLCEKIWNQSYHNCRMLPLIFRPARTERIWWSLGWYRRLVAKDWKSIAIKNIVAKEDVSV